jgi:uncharacterized repeat protein (TIGR03803 family)
MRKLWLAISAFVAVVSFANAQTFRVLYNFGTHEGDPVNPAGIIAQGRDGSLYGVGLSSTSFAEYGYEVTRSGVLTTLANLGGDYSGTNPSFGLSLGTDGEFYGTTSDGGPDSAGTIYKFTPGGVFATLYNFTSESGDFPYPLVPPIQGVDGDFYGTTAGGSACNSGASCGTVYAITPAGTFTELHTFDETDGESVFTALVQGTDGGLYGIADGGGSKGYGTFFRVSPSGKFAVLYNFDLAHAPDPTSITQGSDGSFYGITPFSGPDGTSYAAVFKISHGVLTILHQFSGVEGIPSAGLVQATDGNFYGATDNGTSDCGSIYRMIPGGSFTTLHTFSCTDGYQPSALLQHTDGRLYGTTTYGGTAGTGDGVFFRLDLGLAPFVTFLPAARQVGHTVEILGQGFTGTSAVSFNGAPAAFTVYADTYLTANVPEGATSGLIQVTTPSGTLMSNKPFHVKPQISSFSPTSGPVGTSVVITGVSLTETSKITFNNVVATDFTVNSDSQVTVLVPVGATTTKIGLTTTGAPVYSAGAFTLTQ